MDQDNLLEDEELMMDNESGDHGHHRAQNSSSTSLNNDSRSTLLGEFDAINVIVRVRPTVVSSSLGTAAERARDPSSLFPAAGQIQLTDPQSGQARAFTFNVVFEPEASQEEVFEHSGVKRLINQALEGFACTVFAYGQTGSGKTFTLTGNVFQDLGNTHGQTTPSSSSGHHHPHPHQDQSSNNNKTKGSSSTKEKKKVIGLVQFAFAYLFEQIKLRKERGVNYVVTCSFLEVYNETVLDLLNPSHKSLAVRWAKDRGFYAENLFKVECEDVLDLEGVLAEGSKSRSVRAHQMNETSSRSHSLLTISLASETQDPEDPSGFIRREGRLCLVDLAGSEKTKRTLSKGDTLVEANNINRSLLVLGNCISSLSSSRRRTGHVPYRDSTLTKLLADSLSGSGMTLMIACVSPLPQDGSETINTLRYAMRAKKVRTNPIVRMDPRELLILSLKREVRLLRMENIYLRQQLNLGSGFLPSTGNANSLSQLSSAGAANTTSTTMVEEGGQASPSLLARNGQQELRAPHLSQLLQLHQANLESSPLSRRQVNGGAKEEEEGTVAASIKDDLLHKYMSENEGLRSENSQLHAQRSRLIHDHEEVCRDNERLARRLQELLLQTQTTSSSNNGVISSQSAATASINDLGHHHQSSIGQRQEEEDDDDEEEPRAPLTLTILPASSSSSSPSSTNTKKPPPPLPTNGTEKPPGVAVAEKKRERGRGGEEDGRRPSIVFGFDNPEEDAKKALTTPSSSSSSPAITAASQAKQKTTATTTVAAGARSRLAAKTKNPSMAKPSMANGNGGSLELRGKTLLNASSSSSPSSNVLTAKALRERAAHSKRAP